MCRFADGPFAFRAASVSDAVFSHARSLRTTRPGRADSNTLISPSVNHNSRLVLVTIVGNGFAIAPSHYSASGEFVEPLADGDAPHSEELRERNQRNIPERGSSVQPSRIPPFRTSVGSWLVYYNHSRNYWLLTSRNHFVYG